MLVRSERPRRVHVTIALTIPLRNGAAWTWPAPSLLVPSAVVILRCGSAVLAAARFLPSVATKLSTARSIATNARGISSSTLGRICAAAGVVPLYLATAALIGFTAHVAVRRQSTTITTRQQLALVGRPNISHVFIPTLLGTVLDVASRSSRNALTPSIALSIASGVARLREIRQRGVATEYVDPILVFTRDRWRCQLCGRSTPTSLCGKQKSCSPTVDHIVPIARGGAHSYQNVQCACLRCNVRKQARIKGQFRLF